MRRNRTDRTCEKCGALFSVPAHRVATARFCKRACALNAPKRVTQPRPRDAAKRETRTCANCGTAFETWVMRRQECCSYPCSMARYRAGGTERFLAKVNKNGPVIRADLGACWVWTGALFSNGYGQAPARGRTERMAHRVAWELAYGEVPEDRWVLHHCDNPPCVNPGHLFLGDNGANMRDMVSKGRRDYAKKLTPDTVRAIRAEYTPAYQDQLDLAAKYGVNVMTIRNIGRRETWKHLPDTPTNH